MARQEGFSRADLLVSVVVAAGLILAAWQSKRLVLEGRGETESADPPALEYRDQIYGAAAIDERILWLVGNYGKILRSDDGGVTWRAQVSPTPVNLQDVDAWSSERAVAVGNQGTILVTADGGGSWREVQAPRSEIANKLFRIRTAGNGRAWAVGAGGMIVYSEDWGGSWVRRSPQEDVAWNDIALHGGGTWVVGEFGRIMYSPNGGESWQEQASPVERSLMGVAFQDDLNGIAVGLDGLIVRTDDGGTSWARVPRPTPVHLYSVAWTGDGWLVAGDGGLVLSGSPEAVDWTVAQLASTELGWHTEAIRTGDRWLLVGATQGFLQGDKWTRL